MSTITFVSQRVEERDSSHFLEFLKFGPYSRSPLNRRRGGWPIKVMLKITEIIVAKIKSIWSRCRDIDQVRKTKERGQYTAILTE